MTSPNEILKSNNIFDPKNIITWLFIESALDNPNNPNTEIRGPFTSTPEGQELLLRDFKEYCKDHKTPPSAETIDATGKMILENSGTFEWTMETSPPMKVKKLFEYNKDIAKAINALTGTASVAMFTVQNRILWPDARQQSGTKLIAEIRPHYALSSSKFGKVNATTTFLKREDAIRHAESLLIANEMETWKRDGTVGTDRFDDMESEVYTKGWVGGMLDQQGHLRSLVTVTVAVAEENERLCTFGVPSKQKKISPG